MTGMDDRLVRALFETATDAVVVHDKDTFEIVDVNPAACELFGLCREDFLGKNILELSAQPELTAAAASQDHLRISSRLLKRANGSTFPADISANSFEYGDRVLRVAYVRDVSERMRAEEALMASESRFAVAFKTSPDSVNINRLCDGLFLDISQGFTKLTGYTEEDVRGKSSLEIELWADPEDRARLVQGLRDHGQIENLEATFRLKNGELKTGLMSARVIDIGGEPCILSVTRDISHRKQMEEALKQGNERLARISQDVIVAMGRIVELRDPYTQGHQQGVSRIAAAIARELGMSGDAVAAVEVAGLLHDIGKLYIPIEILAKPGVLSELEMDLVRTHPEHGFSILKDVAFSWPIAEIVLQHHERLDGSGYPNHLTDRQIDPLARVLAVADVVEAMASHRPYRPALGMERALDEIRDHGNQYDHDVVHACVDLYDRGLIAV